MTHTIHKRQQLTFRTWSRATTSPGCGATTGASGPPTSCACGWTSWCGSQSPSGCPRSRRRRSKSRWPGRPFLPCSPPAEFFVIDSYIYQDLQKYSMYQQLFRNVGPGRQSFGGGRLSRQWSRRRSGARFGLFQLAVQQVIQVAIGFWIGMFRLTETENSVNRCFCQNQTETVTDFSLLRKPKSRNKKFNNRNRQKTSFSVIFRFYEKEYFIWIRIIFLSNLLNISYFTLFSKCNNLLHIWFHLKSALKNHHFSVWNTIFSKCNKLLHIKKMKYAPHFIRLNFFTQL